MRRLFGKKKEVAPPPSLTETSDKIGGRTQKMDQEISELNTKINSLMREAKLPQNRGRVQSIKGQAMQYLKRRKMLETQLSQLQGQRFNVDQLAFNQEQIKTNIETVTVMKANAAVIKDQLKQVKVDDAEDVMDDMEDMMGDTSEISEILSGNMGNDIDEGELEGEWDALQGELESGNVDLGALDETPAAPAKEKVSQQ